MSSKKLAERKAKAARIVHALKKLFPDAKISLNFSNDWELMVAVQLSAQCTDKKVNEVTAKLFKKYRTLDDYVKASASLPASGGAVGDQGRRTVKKFEQDIKPTGFYHNKAKNILAAAKMVKEKFGGKIPETMDEILTLPGVARKTANVVLGNAHGVVQGIAVDTHVRRLAQKLGLTDHRDPEKIERDLMAILPEKEWFSFTYRLIEYGRKYCPAKPHDHARCPLAKFAA